MIDPLAKYDSRVRETLEQCAKDVHKVGPDGYRFALNGGVAVEVTAHVEHDWLLMTAPLGGLDNQSDTIARRAAQLLALNSQLTGAAKIGLAEDPPRIQLSAEIPLEDEDVDVTRQLADTCAGFTFAASQIGRSMAARRGSSPEVQREPCDAEPSVDGTKHLLEEISWPFAERQGERMAVTLDVTEGFHQALVERKREGLVLTLALSDTVIESAASQCAASLFLLTACRLVRMARATASGPGETTRLAWEVTLPGEPTACQLKHALSSLSVACQLSAREVQFLLDESVARCYLAVRGWSPYLLQKGSRSK